MGLFNFGRSNTDLQAQQAREQTFESESALRRAQMEELQELLRHLDEERGLLLTALEVLRPGMAPKDLGAAMLELCFKPFSLASFYLAVVDWDQEIIQFPLYHEGGRLRNVSWRVTSHGGLTGRALQQCAPFYLRTLEELMEAGALLTEAERASGLVPQSWYGVPLGCGAAWGERPFGLLSFQSFQKDAFSESQRNLMNALGKVTAYAMRAGPGCLVAD